MDDDTDHQSAENKGSMSTHDIESFENCISQTRDVEQLNYLMLLLKSQMRHLEIVNKSPNIFDEYLAFRQGVANEGQIAKVQADLTSDRSKIRAGLEEFSRELNYQKESSFFTTIKGLLSDENFEAGSEGGVKDVTNLNENVTSSRSSLGAGNKEIPKRGWRGRKRIISFESLECRLPQAGNIFAERDDFGNFTSRHNIKSFSDLKFNDASHFYTLFVNSAVDSRVIDVVMMDQSPYEMIKNDFVESISTTIVSTHSMTCTHSEIVLLADESLNSVTLAMGCEMFNWTKLTQEEIDKTLQDDFIDRQATQNGVEYGGDTTGLSIISAWRGEL